MEYCSLHGFVLQLGDTALWGKDKTLSQIQDHLPGWPGLKSGLNLWRVETFLSQYVTLESRCLIKLKIKGILRISLS